MSAPAAVPGPVRVMRSFCSALIMASHPVRAIVR
jgi:hypothetical protein